MTTAFLRLGAFAGGALLALTTSIAPAQAGQEIPPPSARPPAVIEASAPSLHPEGVAWDPYRRSFLVSSVRHGTVSLVGLDGTVRPFLADPRMVSTFGVHVDVARNRVLVAYGDIGLGARSRPSTVGRVTGLGVFDLRTGRLEHLVDLATTPGRHAANDVAVDAVGNAYVTDVFASELHRVTPEGRASVLVRDSRFASPTFGLNGIVWHPSGFLLAVRYDTGALFRVSLRSRTVSEVRLDAPLLGGDGMLLRPDGSLLVVTNSLDGTGADAQRVVRSLPGARWAAATTVAERASVDPSTTTVARSPLGEYTLSGRLDLLLAGETTDRFVLRRR